MSLRIELGLLLAMLIVTVGCTGPRAGVTWYEARCVDQYAMRPGTAEFSACVSRERRIVEETQARGDRLDP